MLNLPKFTFGARSSRQRPASQRGERGTPRDGNWLEQSSQTRRHNKIYMNNGPLAQLVERLHGMQKVTGSNPVRSTSGPVVQQVEHCIRIAEVSGSSPLWSTSDLTFDT